MRTTLGKISFVLTFVLRKPILLMRITYGLFLVYFLKRKRFRFIDLAVTYECNMHCSHCSATNFQKGNTGRKSLSHDDFRKLASQFHKMGGTLCHFTGGEPLLRKDLPELIRIFKPWKTAISLQSNGLLATEERLLELKKAGLDIFCVSIDSGIAEEHDKFRNRPGSFVKAWEAVETALRIGLTTSISTCVSHENLNSEGLRKVIEMAREKKITCQFNLAVPIGNWKRAENYMLTEEDKGKWREILRDNPHCRIDLGTTWRQWGCSTVKEKLYITAFGDVIPCPFIHISLGNIRDESLEKIRKRAMLIPQFSKYSDCCLAAEDNDFIRTMPCYNDWQGDMPIPYQEVPDFSRYLKA